VSKAAIAVLNAGSSSIKVSLFAQGGADLAPVLHGQVEAIDSAPRFAAKNAEGTTVSTHAWPDGTRLGHEGALEHIVAFLRDHAHRLPLAGIGHRVVHGGMKYAQPVRMDRKVLADLETLVPLAPLHQPHNLEPIRLTLERQPDLPQVACFDTAFHRAQPASMCALAAGRSVASTMGFTAVDGLPMGTRCGALDPGVVLYLMDQRGMDARPVEKLIYTQSGLLGVSGIASDMRTLLASDAPRAQLAVDLYVYRIGRELGSLAAALGGLDAIVFTGGIGENSAEIRARVCQDAAWLGVALDEKANRAGEAHIGAVASKTAVWTIPTNEELMIARHTRRALA
jgi:acetate kinase